MEQKNKNILLVITVVTLIVVVFGATYAYFVAQTGLGASANMNIQAGTTDSLMFEVGSNILIDANQENFGKDKGNLVGTTSAKAVFKPGSTPNENPYKYNVFFIINDNNFVYTRDENTPELIMKITSPTGEQIENIIGLNYTNDTFDITGKLGSFLLTKDYEITGTTEVTQEWLVEVTLVNLDSDQQANTGKTFSGSIFITTENIDTYVPAKAHNINITTTKNSITTDLEVTKGTVDIDKYYFAIKEDTSEIAYNNKLKMLASKTNEENLEWHESDVPSFTFTNLKERTKYIVYGYAVDINNVKTDVKEMNAETAIYFSEYIKSTYETDDMLYYHDANLANGAGDNSYRYAGPHDSVNNFVCFGSDAEDCPNDNLYRIIGVFDNKVKLIKYDYATKEQLGTDGDYSSYDVTSNVGYYKGNMTTIPYYYWNNLKGNSSTNDWSLSRLNKTNLNTNYLTNLGTNWTDKIVITTWSVGGMTLANGREKGAKTAYDYELGTNKIYKTYNAKIGLMYLSEYYYSASPEHWAKPGNNSDATKDYRLAINQNWMYIGGVDWTTSPRSDSITYAFLVNDTGNVDYYNVNDYYGIRPTFSLIPEVILASGEGTKPILIV